MDGIRRKDFNTNDDFTGARRCLLGGGKMSEQNFMRLPNVVVRASNRTGKKPPGYIAKHLYNRWFTSNTGRRAGAQYRFIYAEPARRRIEYIEINGDIREYIFSISLFTRRIVQTV
ncbi:hypothetical protein PHMEG_00040709 [Phytophthora megakarya]|uniref:Uncharacterized protein n=1 Tax=Phytophthora megakarya TaxID=4795 RepID=A0A225UCH6_9STRA|nr:hypothetical protein PHMEG_00040709 [Phytophthora megakarya]